MELMLIVTIFLHEIILLNLVAAVPPIADEYQNECDFSRYHAFNAAPSEIPLNVEPCTAEVVGQCCKQDEYCKCNGDILESFPVQCSIEPTYCAPKTKELDTDDSSNNFTDSTTVIDSNNFCEAPNLNRTTMANCGSFLFEETKCEEGYVCCFSDEPTDIWGYCTDEAYVNDNGGCCKKSNHLDCQTFCTLEYTPVCGTDGNTYSNNCTLEAAACEGEVGDLTIAYEGECESCTDTPSWDDGSGFNCDFYQQFCESGGIIQGHEALFRNITNYPELNCCRCGKGEGEEPGYLYYKERGCDGRNEIFTGSVGSRDECSSKCNDDISCISFEWWGEVNPHPQGPNHCHLSSSCTYELSTETGIDSASPDRSDLYVKVTSSCNSVDIADPRFIPDACGEQCGSNPFNTITTYCEKGEKCCVSGPFGKECSTSCGPYDPDESFGTCQSDSECCTMQDAGCNLQCKSNQECRYADWVVPKTDREVLLLVSPLASDCNQCVSEFADKGGCDCMQNESCDVTALIPEGCFPCGDKAMAYCDSKAEIECELQLCNSNGNCTVFADLKNPNVEQIEPMNITDWSVQGQCCWRIYDTENFTGNYQMIYPEGSGKRNPLLLSIPVRSITYKPNCYANPFECVDPPVCTMYNEDNAPDPSNPRESLMYCDPNQADDCKIKTEGVFETCHEVNDATYVCVPSEKQQCDDNSGCTGIGNIHSGQLMAFCHDGECSYDRGIVIA